MSKTAFLDFGFGLVQVGTDWYRLVWVDMGWYRLVWVGMSWYHGYNAITKQNLIIKANWVGMGLPGLTITIIPILTTILTSNILNGKTNLVN